MKNKISEQQEDSRGILYIIATPIGNLEDITFRAIRILSEVDLVLCEDTRTTRVLLNHYEIKTKTESYNAHATDKKHVNILDMLRDGKKLALVSDAGTPTISDPGSLLVEMVKRELGDSVLVVPVPGAAAFVAALSAGGIPAPTFTFLGFLPHKKGRETLFKEIANRTRPYVFYESPHRILKTMESLANIKVEKIVVAREITKHFETIWQGSPNDFIQYSQKDPNQLKGEFVIIVS